MKNAKKIAVLISGGVDSSVALSLLAADKSQEITAFYLKIWLEDELEFLGECPWEEDLKFARQVCEQNGVELKVINMQKEYFDTVVDYTIKEVKAGRTPNPDIMCNNHIKFGLFMEKIGDHYDRVATGHYAKIGEKDGRFFLEKSPDPIKDQTYFLCRLSQDQLKKIIFPIGHLPKSEVRALAEKFKLPNKNRKDSQGICFLGKVKFQEFVEHYLGTKAGDLVEFESGEKVGEHKGFWYYTIGQRKDIRLPDGPWYVVEKDSAKNIVYVSRNYHSEDKSRDTLQISDFNWFLNKFPQSENLSVKLRHGEQEYRCELTQIDENTATVKLAESDQGIAPGQFAVFYDQDICLGSGVII